MARKDLDVIIIQSAAISPSVDAIPLWTWQVLVLAGAAGSLGVLYQLASRSDAWIRQLRARLLFGIPWGTVLSMGVVLFVYLVFQGGLNHLHDPVTYAFQATAYEYPLGILTSAFAHQSFGHLFGNLAGTLIFGAIAEYGFDHFPDGRREAAVTSTSFRQNPLTRILAFVGAVVVAGLLFGAFAWGPVIGFSGVVFALAGVALLVRPLVAVVGLLAVESHLPRLLYNAFIDPVLTVQPSPSSGRIWFADMAVQGHLFGFLLGILVATVLVHRRDRIPNPGHVWLGAFVFSTAQGLWTAYWYLGNEQYVLFRGGGVTFVFVLTATVLVAIGGSDRRILPDVAVRSHSIVEGVPSKAKAATSVLLVLVLAMAAVGMAINLATITDTSIPNNPVEIRDYKVGYTENVTNKQLAVLDVPVLEQVTSVEASGVIVASDRRNIWQVATSTDDLAFRGYTRVLVGGVGWRKEVWVTRTGWSAVGGATTYRVRLRPPDAPVRTVYTSDSATSDVIIANRSLSLRTTLDDFEIVVRRNGSLLGTARLPPAGQNMTVGGIRFERVGNRLYANFRGTRVQVAKKNKPGIERFRDEQ